MFEYVDKIDLIMYLQNCGFNMSIHDLLKHIKTELSNKLIYKSQFLS